MSLDFPAVDDIFPLFDFKFTQHRSCSSSISENSAAIHDDAARHHTPCDEGADFFETNREWNALNSCHFLSNNCLGFNLDDHQIPCVGISFPLAV